MSAGRGLARRVLSTRVEETAMKTKTTSTSPFTFAASIAAVLAGCATARLPAETPLTADALVVTVPRDVEDAGAPLRGIHFHPIDRVRAQDDILPGVHSTANTIQDFFSVSFVPGSGTLETRVCRGEQHADGHRYRSCVSFDARVAVADEPAQSRVVITPFRMRTEQGRNAIFIPIALPRVTLADWYRYITDQSVACRHKITSRFGPESIKGNYDRGLPHPEVTERDANSALRQFKDAYVIEGGAGTSLRVGMAFYPYRDGSLVDMYLVGRAAGRPTAAPIDWTDALTSGKSRLDAMASE